MKRLAICVIGLCLLQACQSAHQPFSSDAIQYATRTGRMLRNDVGWLTHPARGGRDTGSEGCRKAAEYLEEKLNNFGLQPLFLTGWRQTFEVDLSRGVYFSQLRRLALPRFCHLQHLNSLPAGKLSGGMVDAWNIGGYLPGTGELADEWILLGAHYDHIGMGDVASRDPAVKRGAHRLHPGADDNASGVAALLAVVDTLQLAWAQAPGCAASQCGSGIFRCRGTGPARFALSGRQPRSVASETEELHGHDRPGYGGQRVAPAVVGV